MRYIVCISDEVNNLINNNKRKELLSKYSNFVTYSLQNLMRKNLFKLNVDKIFIHKIINK